jgi:hypothetical protein
MVATANRLSLDAYRREMKLGPVEAATGWRGTGGTRDSSSPATAGHSLPAAAHLTAGLQGAAASEVNARVGGLGASRAGEAAQDGHKYSAVATDGPDGSGGQRRYQSKKGARLAQRLEAERLAGGIVAWVPEVSLPVGTLGTRAIRHIVDALVVLDVRADGSFVGRFVEAKGFRVREGERKRRALEQRLGVKVEVV